jgi:hypothetical protein
VCTESLSNPPVRQTIDEFDVAASCLPFATLDYLTWRCHLRTICGSNAPVPA